MSASMGWTWDYTEWNLDLPRLAELTAYWRGCPPPSVQLARINAALSALLGISPRIDPAPQGAPPGAQAADSNLGELMEQMPQGEMPNFVSADEYMKRKGQGQHGG